MIFSSFKWVLYGGYSPFFLKCVYFCLLYPTLIFDVYRWVYIYIYIEREREREEEDKCPYSCFLLWNPIYRICSKLYVAWAGVFKRRSGLSALSASVIVSTEYRLLLAFIRVIRFYINKVKKQTLLQKHSVLVVFKNQQRLLNFTFNIDSRQHDSNLKIHLTQNSLSYVDKVILILNRI